MSEETEKAQGGDDFEGHKMDLKIEEKVESDFEGHKMELKIEEKVLDKLEQ